MIDIYKPYKEDPETGFKIFYDRTVNYPNGRSIDPKNHGVACYNYDFYNNVGYGCKYIYNVTNNCQIASFAGFESLLGSSDHKELLKWFIEEMRSIGLMKSQFLIDIKDRSGNVDKVKALFEGQIVFEQPYKSTNNSDMVMFLVKSGEL